MIVLGIETSTARSSVTLLVDGSVVAEASREDARGHGAFLAPAMQRCLDAAPRDGGTALVDAVAVGTGPGLYTGLRVGLATAAAFATARRLPIVGIGGMDALAHAVGPVADHVVTTLDARRGQVFWAVHRTEGARLARCEGPQVGSQGELDTLLAELAARGSIEIVGEVGTATMLRPDAADTARLALDVLAAAPHAELVASALAPVYLRDADVRIGWEQRGGVRAGSTPVSVLVAPLGPPGPAEGSADAAALVALERATQARPATLATLLADAIPDGSGRARGTVLVAREDTPGGGIVGMGSARLLVDEVHVMRLAVDGAWRRRGVGRALLDAIVAFARSVDATAVVLEVRAGNAAAQALYSAAGFRVEGSRPRYYPDGEDALLLRLPLDARRP